MPVLPAPASNCSSQSPGAAVTIETASNAQAPLGGHEKMLRCTQGAGREQAGLHQTTPKFGGQHGAEGDAAMQEVFGCRLSAGWQS